MSFATKAGLTLPSDGRILLIGAPGDLLTEALPLERCAVVQGFNPDHDLWQRRGVPVALHRKATLPPPSSSCPARASWPRRASPWLVPRPPAG
nr:hypothetical protein [Salipiger bermudensis]